MKAITIEPGRPTSLQLESIGEPPPGDGSVLVETIAVGICGTDREIVAGLYGTAPPGKTRLALGHESLGRVLSAPDDSGFSPGDLVVAIVRRPDPVPCEACAVGEWDMCRNGRYTEHGIKGLDGFCRERFRVNVPFLVPVDRALGICGVLMEPASIVAKAWDQIQRISSRSRWTPHTVLVLGAGPIGLLAALFATLRGFDVHVLDRATAGPKPDLVHDLGATYHTGPVAEACSGIDVVLECTGSPRLVFDAMRCAAPTGLVCLTGVTSGHRNVTVDAAMLNNQLVLGNNVVFGTVNANRLHYTQAADALQRSNGGWLRRLITRQVPIASWSDAYDRKPDDIKAILQFANL